MIKKLSALFVLLFLYGIFVFSANAQNTTTNTSTPSSRLTDLKNQRIEIRQRIKDTVQAKREELKETVQARRDQFKLKLEDIKDEKKRMLAENIDTKLNTINQRHTDNFTEILGKFQEFLDRISNGVIDENILDTISDAQKAIDTASTAIENQAAKTYTAQITSESALRVNFGTTVSQLRKDLMAVHKLVVDAKQAVRSVISEKENMEKDATSSANVQ